MRALRPWLLPAALLMLGVWLLGVWLLGARLHDHWLDLVWAVRDLGDAQWSPDLTRTRLWLDALQVLLGVLSAALVLRSTRRRWRYALALAMLTLGMQGSGLLNLGGGWSLAALTVIAAALIGGLLERPRRTARLLLWGYAAVLAGSALWQFGQLPLDSLAQTLPLLGSTSLALRWFGVAVPALRDTGLALWLLCAALIWLGRSPGTLQNGIVRSLVFVGLSLGTALVFTAVVGGVAGLLHAQNSFWPPLVAAGLVAAGLEPARSALSRSIRRVLYGERDDPSAVMQGVAQRLEGSGLKGSGLKGSGLKGSGLKGSGSASLPGVSASLEGALQEVATSLRLPYLALEWEGAETLRYGELPAAFTPLESMALVAGGERVGVFRAARRHPREAFTPAERRLLEGVSRQLASAAYSWQLADQLQSAQVNLIRAGEEERRRLRRDLHDGLGPALSGLGLKLEAASIVLTRSPEQAADYLRALKLEVQESVQEVRRLVHDLRPPKLDDLGLEGALEELLRGARQAGLDAALSVQEALPPLGAAVEVAVYRIAQEAVTNVLKHAQASRVQLSLSADARTLTLECLDDGVGLPEVRDPGVGSRSMRERAGALSGQLELCSVAESGAAPGGTRVRAFLPLRTPTLAGPSREPHSPSSQPVESSP
ncbi:sensor histidine kinase [Deinococcus sp.]|uniref:sensor histidine kinase n=1 Tax=Deinococcus sp. TaxID=47478 RepID=UPI003CC53CF5